jgi:hypothetical protein
MGFFNTDSYSWTDPKLVPPDNRSEIEKLIAEAKAFSELIDEKKADWIDRLHQVEQDLNDHACELPEGWRDIAIDNLDTALSSVSYAVHLIEKLDTVAIDEIHETLKGAKEDADHMYEVSESRFEE